VSPTKRYDFRSPQKYPPQPSPAKTPQSPEKENKLSKNTKAAAEDEEDMGFNFDPKKNSNMNFNLNERQSPKKTPKKTAKK
jgi:hypothetical protein